MIDQLPGVLYQQLQQAWQPILTDIGDITNVPIENLRHIILEPRSVTNRSRLSYDVGIAAAQYKRD